jgi:hypothetical protein
MTMKKIIQKYLPHIVSVFLFILISTVYFNPQIQGYLLHQSDIEHHIGMSKEISDYRTLYDSEPLWTGATFSGMPTYQISTRNSNIISSIKNLILKLIPRPIGYMFFLMVGFYILLLCLDVNPWVSLIGALAFGLCSLHVLYLGSGHNSKIHAISFIPPLLGGILFSYRKNLFTGAAIPAIFA